MNVCALLSSHKSSSFGGPLNTKTQVGNSRALEKEKEKKIVCFLNRTEKKANKESVSSRPDDKRRQVKSSRVKSSRVLQLLVLPDIVKSTPGGG